MISNWRYGAVWIVQLSKSAGKGNRGMIDQPTVGKAGPEVALRFAKELIRLHPNAADAKEAQAIIDQIMKQD